ncbi:hypothetical protein BHE74_00016323 [Ensete ventricosum]|nr:hypothetical protein BHE74_00016323 [Ensete ventricosum]
MQRIPTARVVFWPGFACCWNVAKLGVEKRGIYRKQRLSVFGLGDLTRRPRPRRKDSRRELRERVSDGEGSVYGSTSIAKDVRCSTTTLAKGEDAKDVIVKLVEEDAGDDGLRDQVAHC